MPPLVRRLLVVAAVLGALVWLEVGPAPGGKSGFHFLLDDAAWRAGLAKEAHPAWLAPFLSAVPSSCPPKPPL